MEMRSGLQIDDIFERAGFPEPGDLKANAAKIHAWCKERGYFRRDDHPSRNRSTCGLTGAYGYVPKKKKVPLIEI